MTSFHLHQACPMGNMQCHTYLQSDQSSSDKSLSQHCTAALSYKSSSLNAQKLSNSQLQSTSAMALTEIIGKLTKNEVIASVSPNTFSASSVRMWRNLIAAV